MPSGYEKSEDYGGPEPGWGGTRAVVILLALLVVAVLLVHQWQ